MVTQISRVPFSARANEIAKHISLSFQFHDDIIAASLKEFIMPYWRLFYHVVWGTKNRLPLIESAWETDLYGYIWGKATALECIPHAINGMPNHIHVIISIPPKLSVATLIGQLKGASSHRVNKIFVSDKSFAWQAEYGVLSFPEKALSTLIEYVKNQKKHHAENWLNESMEYFDVTE
jgi:putative transposase